MAASLKAPLAKAAAAALVAAASLAAFAPALDNGFVAWDDPVNVIGNVHLRAWTWANLRWMMGPSVNGLFIPLNWLSLAADFHVWGLEPAGYHLGSVLWHAAGALLWFGFWKRLFRAATKASDWDAGLAAAFATLLFAVHPMRVESVAWVTERRDVVCGFFYAAALRLYLEYALGEERWLLAGSLACQAAALLSKPTAAALPAALLILDVYPLRRLPARIGSWRGRERLAILAEKVPFALLSLAVLAVNWVWAARSGDIHGLAEHGPWERLVRASYSLLFYPRKMVWPFHLLPIYELPHPFHVGSIRFIGWVSAAAGAVLLSWRIARRRPAFGAAAVYYAAAWLPISGLVIHGVPHLAFDRYSYLPLLGFAGLAGGLLLRGLERRRLRPFALSAAAALLIFLGAASWRRCLDWRDGRTLWTDALAKAPDCEVARVNLAAELSLQGRWAEAARQARLATELEAGDALAWKDLGAAQLSLGETSAASEAFRKAISLKPEDAEARRGLARVLALQGAGDAALEQLSAAIAASPDDAALRLDRAQVLLGLGRQEPARLSLEEALRLQPDLAPARTDLGLILQARRRWSEAEEQYRAALRGGPSPEALFNLANVEALQGRLARAARLYAEALRVQPDFPPAAENLRRVSAALKRG